MGFVRWGIPDAERRLPHWSGADSRPLTRAFGNGRFQSKIRPVFLCVCPFSPAPRLYVRPSPSSAPEPPPLSWNRPIPPHRSQRASRVCRTPFSTRRVLSLSRFRLLPFRENDHLAAFPVEDASRLQRQAANPRASQAIPRLAARYSASPCRPSQIRLLRYLLERPLANALHIFDFVTPRRAQFPDRVNSVRLQRVQSPIRKVQRLYGVAVSVSRLVAERDFRDRLELGG